MDVAGSVWFASEMKALKDDCERFETFPPGHIYSSKEGEYSQLNHVRYRYVFMLLGMADVSAYLYCVQVVFVGITTHPGLRTSSQQNLTIHSLFDTHLRK